MKRLLVALFAVVIGSAFTFEAEARRFGGGGSAGLQRSAPIKRDAAPSQAPNQATPTRQGAQQAAGGSRWLGPIAGIAAGLGIYALASHLGLSEELANFMMLLLLALAVFFIIRMLLRRMQPQTERAQYVGATGGISARSSTAPLFGSASTAPASNAMNVPRDFDVASFLRHAKLNFVRLQAANDAGDMENIRKFTTPEMYAEIKLQHEERGRAPQQTEVVSLDAELLDFATEFGEQIASVRFFGTIRETANGAPAPFDEIWHITKTADDSRGWAIAGIQQTE